MPVLWSIHLNSSYWSNPEVFKPDRFIAENGSLTKPDAFLPFQSGKFQFVFYYVSNIFNIVKCIHLFDLGKRMCIGDEFARMIIFLFSACILQKFSLSALPNSMIDLEGQCGITLVPKSQPIVFEKRLEK